MRERERKSRRLAKALRSDQTQAEWRLWNRLRRPPQIQYKFRRQHPVGPYILDFAHLGRKLAVEIDGATHSEDYEIARDRQRTAFLETLGWRVLRFTNDDVYRCEADVLSAIWQALEG